MKRTKLISKTLYIFCLIMSIIYGITTLYALVCKLTNINIHYSGSQEIIEYPFKDSSFLILDATWSYWVFSFLIPILFYALFFFFLANVFKVFLQPKLFISENIVHLKRFYIYNIFTSVILVLIASFFEKIEMPVFIIVALHFFLGVFVFILSEIFKQGLNLQSEQDLYI